MKTKQGSDLICHQLCTILSANEAGHLIRLHSVALPQHVRMSGWTWWTSLSAELSFHTCCSFIDHINALLFVHKVPSSFRTSSSSCAAASPCSSWRPPWVSSPVRGASPAGGRCAHCLRVRKHTGALKAAVTCSFSFSSSNQPCSSFRHWLRDAGDWSSSKHILHRDPRLGHFLPLQLLHHGAAVGRLWALLEHR